MATAYPALDRPRLRFFGQFLCFAGVGALGTLVHYITLVVLVQFAPMTPLLASIAGFLLGALINYRLNHSFTFQSRMRHSQALTRFFSIVLAGVLLNAPIMTLSQNVLALHYLLAQMTATAVVLLWNFWANLQWTFQENRNATQC